jgi:hypothetical protein
LGLNNGQVRRTPTPNAAAVEPVAKVMMPPVVPLGGDLADLSVREGVTVIEPNRELSQPQSKRESPLLAKRLMAVRDKADKPENASIGGERREKGEKSEKKRHKRGKHGRSSSTRELLPLHAMVARHHRPSLSVGGSPASSPDAQRRTILSSHAQPSVSDSDTSPEAPISPVVEQKEAAAPVAVSLPAKAIEPKPQRESKRSQQPMPVPLHSATATQHDAPVLDTKTVSPLALPSPPAMATAKMAFSQPEVEAYQATTPKQEALEAGTSKLSLLRSIAILLVLWLAIVLSAFTGIPNSPTAGVALTSVAVVLYLGLYGGSR